MTEIETYEIQMREIIKGGSVVVGVAFLDWAGNHKDWYCAQIRTLPNPNRVGLLDVYVATWAD